MFGSCLSYGATEDGARDLLNKVVKNRGLW